MRPMLLLLPLAALGAPALAQPAPGPAAAAEAPVAAEARAFMAAYADELRAGNRAAIAARYDRRGAWLMGGGGKENPSHAAIIAFYAGPGWRPPAAFEWRELSFEPLGRDAVAVVGLFHWTGAAGQSPRIFSYSAVLVRQDGQLRIRIEHEDPMPELRTAN